MIRKGKAKHKRKVASKGRNERQWRKVSNDKDRKERKIDEERTMVGNEEGRRRRDVKRRGEEAIVTVCL